MQNSKGRTPLHEAVISGNKKMVEILLKSGADVNAKDSNGKKPLDYANSYEISEVLHKYETSNTSLTLSTSYSSPTIHVPSVSKNKETEIIDTTTPKKGCLMTGAIYGLLVVLFGPPGLNVLLGLIIGIICLHHYFKGDKQDN